MKRIRFARRRRDVSRETGADVISKAVVAVLSDLRRNPLPLTVRHVIERKPMRKPFSATVVHQMPDGSQRRYVMPVESGWRSSDIHVGLPPSERLWIEWGHDQT